MECDPFRNRFKAENNPFVLQDSIVQSVMETGKIHLATGGDLAFSK